MPAADLLMQRKVPTRLIAMTFSNTAMSWARGSPVSRFLPTVLAAGAMPAQLTSTRSWPWAALALAKPASTLASLVTSTAQKTPPISAAIASPAASFRSKIATFTPLSASARAVAAPSPDAPPVTTAAMLLSRIIAFFLFLPRR